MNQFYLLLNRQENYQTWRLITTWHYRYIPSGLSHHDGCRRYGTKSLWKKSMLLALCAGNSPVAKARVAELWCFLWSRLNKRWVNTRHAGDLRRHRTHYGLTVMRNHHAGNGNGQSVTAIVLRNMVIALNTIHLLWERKGSTEWNSPCRMIYTSKLWELLHTEPQITNDINKSYLTGKYIG